MKSGDPFAPFFGALQQLNDLLFSGGPEAMANYYRRNLDAIEQSNRVIMDGALDASRRQAEILSRTMEDIATAARAMTTAQNPGNAANIQADLVRNAISTAIDRMNEINQSLTKANAEALEVLRDRLLASLEEALRPPKA